MSRPLRALATLALAALVTLPSTAVAHHGGDSDAFWRSAFQDAEPWTLTTSGSWSGSGGFQRYDMSGNEQGTLEVTLTAQGPMAYVPDRAANLEGKAWPATATIRATLNGEERSSIHELHYSCTLTKTVSTRIDIRGVWNGTRIDGRILLPTEDFEIDLEDWSCSGRECVDSLECEDSNRAMGGNVPLIHAHWAGHRYDLGAKEGDMPLEVATALGYATEGEPWPASAGYLRSDEAYALHLSPWFTVHSNLPWPGGAEPMRESGSASWTVGASKPPEGDSKAAWCETGLMFVGGEGQCSATSELALEAGVDLCEALERFVVEDIAWLRARIQAMPPNPTEEGLLAWRATFSDGLADALSVYRQGTLLGCPETAAMREVWGVVDEASTKYAQALHQLWKEGKLTKKGLDEALGLLREMELLGMDGTGRDAIMEIVAEVGTRGGDGLNGPAGPGELVAQVHSPVALHAYAPDGAHVGWNATTGAPESQVEGARYEGKPGEAQRLTLPVGLWTLVAEGTGEGNYTIEVSWRVGSERGQETWATRDAAPGAHVRTAYFAGYASDGTPSVQAGRILEGDGDFAPSRILIPETSEGSGASGEGASDAAAGLAQTPGPGAAMAVLALALVARRARR